MSDSSNLSRRPRLAVECLEDRTVPTFLTRPGFPKATVNGFSQQATGLSLAIGNVIPEPGFGTQGFFQFNEYVVGTGPGVESQVRVYDLGGNLKTQFTPYVGFTGGVNVAVGDLLGDGTTLIAVSAASALRPNVPQVKVFNAYGGLISQFNVFSTGYLGGISVAVGNVLGGIGTGNRGNGGGGGSGFRSEIIAGAALGNSPHVVVTDMRGNIFRSFFAFDSTYLGGVTLAASSVDSTATPGSTGGGFGGGGGGPVPNTNAYAEIVVGAATNVPHVKVLDVWQAGNSRLDGPAAVVERLSYYAFDPALNRGITVAAGSTDGIQGAEVYVGLVGDARSGGTLIRAFNGEFGSRLAEFQAFPPAYSRVVNMAIGNVTPFDENDPLSNFFNARDLALVAGDGPLNQMPRVFFGVPGSVAGLNGP